MNALDGVSLTTDEGEFVAIIGQSGSGKSTLMNMLGLLDVPTSGEYYINGNLVEDLTDDQMSVIRNEQIGFIFQKYHLRPKYSVLQNVMMPLLFGEKNELSGGQQQRVALHPNFKARS